MKPGMSREIALLMVPVALLGGVGWWMGLGGDRLTTSWWRDARQSRVRVVRSFAWTNAPCDMPARISEADTEVQILADEHIPFWARGAQYVPQLAGVKTSFGPMPMLGRKEGPRMSIGYGGGRGANLLPILTDAKVARPAPFYLTVSVLNVPKSAGEIFMTGSFVAKNLPTTPFRVLARPTWMTRTATHLKVTDVKWHPAKQGSGGQVEVGLLYTGKKRFELRGEKPSGWKPVDSKPSYAIIMGDNSKDELLAHWSQRIESSDRTYNSLDEMMYVAVDASVATKPGQYDHSDLVAKRFEPRVLPLKRIIKGNRVSIIYKVTSLPKNIKTPVFKAEIGLVGDGFAAASYAFKRR